MTPTDVRKDRRGPAPAGSRVPLRGSLWWFAARNLLRSPLRTVLAVLGLSIPVFGMLGLLSLSEGLRSLVAATLGQVRGILVLRENAPTDLFSELPAGLADRLRRVPGVRVAAPQVWKFAPPIEGRRLFARRPGASGAGRAGALEQLLNLVQIEGQDLEEHARLRTEPYRDHLLPARRGGGRFLGPSDRGRFHIVLSKRLAAEYPRPDGSPRRVGDALRIGRHDCTVVGLYETRSLLLDHTIVMEIGAARRLLGIGDETVSCFLVEPDDPARERELAAAIRRAVPSVDARTMSQFQAGVAAALGGLNRLLLLMVGLALVVGAVGILNTMLMSTTERLFELGVLLCNGWSRGDLLLLVLVESILLGLISGGLGVLLALAGVPSVNPFLEEGFQLVLRPKWLGLALALALALGTLGGLYPAWRASRLPPMEVIRRGSR